MDAHLKWTNSSSTSAYEYFWKLAKVNAVNQHLFWEPDGQFQKLITDHLTPHGILFSFDPYKKREIIKDEIEQMDEQLENLKIHDIKNIEERYYIANKVNYIANFWSELQNEDQVSKLYNTAIEVWPQGATINNNYGTYLMSKGYLTKASQYLKKSYEISSHNLTTYKNLANFLFRIKNYHSSLFFLEGFLNKSKTRDEDVESLLGAVNYELEKYSQAEKFLESALEIIKNKPTKNMSKIEDEIKIKWIKLYKELYFEKLML